MAGVTGCVQREGSEQGRQSKPRRWERYPAPSGLVGRTSHQGDSPSLLGGSPVGARLLAASRGHPLPGWGIPYLIGGTRRSDTEGVPVSGLLNEPFHRRVGRPVTLLRLDRAICRNALDLATVDALLEALLNTPEQLVVLGSSTPGTFCAGADLGVPDAERMEVSERLYECYEAMVRRPGLVIAAIDGAAVGGGAQLAAAADIRVAGPAARWRWVGPGHGLAVGAWILPELLGRSRALDLTLTARWLELQEARDAGFVHRVAEDAWAASVALVNELGSAEPDALAHVKEIASPAQILVALRSERQHNRDAWDGHAPPPPGSARGLFAPTP